MTPFTSDKEKKQSRPRLLQSWQIHLGMGVLLLSGSSSAMACWYCAEIAIWQSAKTSLVQIHMGLSGEDTTSISPTPGPSLISLPGVQSNIIANVRDLKAPFQALNDSMKTVTTSATVINDQVTRDLLTRERSHNVKAAALNYAPTVQGCLSATAALGMAKSRGGTQNAQTSYQAAAAGALIRAPRPVSSEMQTHIAQSVSFCTPQQIADEAAAEIPSSQRQCPSQVAGALPGASLLAGSISGGMINPALQPGGGPGLARKANDSIGSTARSPINGNIGPAMAANQVRAASAYTLNVQGPALPAPYDPQAMDTPDGKARKTYWDAFSARMSTIPNTLSAISSQRTVGMSLNAQGVLTPPAPDPVWAQNRPIWQTLFPAESFPDTPSEWERLKFEVARRQSAPGVAAPEHDLAVMGALQLKIDMLKEQRQEENNKLRAALLAQMLYPITKQSLDSMEQNVARGRYHAPSAAP